MNSASLSIKAKIQISKTPPEVYEAIVDPEKMSQYFIAKGSGVMKAGETVMWQFPEFEGEFPIRVKELRPAGYISFCWDNENTETLVEISLAPVSGDATIITVIEGTMENNEAGLKWLMSNTEGWANFLACMKAYLEYNINLRKGAFDYMKAG